MLSNSPAPLSTDMEDFVRAFKRNCPKVRMTKSDGAELERLFAEAFMIGVRLTKGNEP